MAIMNAEWRRQFQQDIYPFLTAAWPDFTNIAAILRDGTNNEVWTELPSDPAKKPAGKTHYSLEGWRTHFKRVYDTINVFNTSHGTKLQGYDSQAKTAMDGYITSLPIIATAFNNVINAHKDGSGNVIQRVITQAERNTLATAIEGQLS